MFCWVLAGRVELKGLPQAGGGTERPTTWIALAWLKAVRWSAEGLSSCLYPRINFVFAAAVPTWSAAAKHALCVCCCCTKVVSCCKACTVIRQAGGELKGSSSVCIPVGNELKGLPQAGGGLTGPPHGEPLHGSRQSGGQLKGFPPCLHQTTCSVFAAAVPKWSAAAMLSVVT